MTTQQSFGTPANKKMKTEHGSAPNSAPGTPQMTSSKAGTPVPTWNASQIPIDPALQQASGASTPIPQPSGTPIPALQATSQAGTPVQVQPMQYIPNIGNRQNYQHYTAYGGGTSYYTIPQYQYSTPQSAAFVSVPAQANVATKPQAQPSQSSTPQPQTQQQTTEQQTSTDISTLNDALGSAGLDLRAEEETLQRSQDHHSTYRSFEDRSRKQPASPSFDVRLLGTTMRTIGANHKVPKISDDSVNYVALALRARLQTLIEGMIAAANHRACAQFDREPGMYEVKGDVGEDMDVDGVITADGKRKMPMWSVVVKRDTRKILEVLERVEREEEMKVRRERRERLDAEAAAAARASEAANSPTMEGTSAGGGVGASIVSDDATPASSSAAVALGGADTPSATPAKKLKKRKDGPGVSAKNMSEDVQKRLSNAVASQAAGLGRGKYAWMNAGGAAVGTAKPKKEVAKSTLGTSTSKDSLSGGTQVNANVATNGETEGLPPSQSQNASSSSPAPNQSQPVATQTTTGPISTPTASSSWAKPYVSVAQRATAGASPAPGDENKTIVTLRDAMFVIERERGHGAGRGAARAWV